MFFLTQKRDVGKCPLSATRTVLHPTNMLTACHSFINKLMEID